MPTSLGESYISPASNNGSDRALVCARAVNVSARRGLKAAAACACAGLQADSAEGLVDVRECNCVAIFMWPEEEIKRRTGSHCGS